MTATKHHDELIFSVLWPLGGREVDQQRPQGSVKDSENLLFRCSFEARAGWWQRNGPHLEGGQQGCDAYFERSTSLL